MLLSTSSQPEILLVGDSMAEGLSPHLVKSLSGRYRFSHLYKRGTTVHYWNKNKEFIQKLTSKKYATILVSLGTNDLKIKSKQTNVYAEFQQKLIESGSNIYWIVPPPMPFKNESVLDWIENPTPPINKIECEGDFKRAKDGVHLLGMEYKRWGTCISDSLP